MGIFMIIPYEIRTISKENEKIFNICSLSNNSFGIVYVGFVLLFKFFIICLMSLLIFMEWNIEETKYDIRFIMTCLYIDTLTVIFLLILHYISIDNYVAYVVVRVGVITILSIMNYLLLYGVRLLFPYFIKSNENILDGKIYANNNNNIRNSSNIQITKTDKSEISQSTGQSKNSSGIISKIITYHYKKSTETLGTVSEMQSYKSGTTTKSSFTSNKL
ncbi:hypothetical protein BCR32DRAFT_287030 [Anaeromyces robustus]|uniref:G-protein coupled receptors family 3 profile domain-containing protein n=1 Tax=Anaeromyces robustus TaxID=1754192 RepID=A0A1Y1VTP8_9FUNG|nr:hypothetical protein BCR32DRAFT_287030 [Anaeromyces robustus]|eukprot:ORX64563.1 hypothetical protein BCR32DRAFT_287030 [Anaeromyces robustus]